MDINPEIMSQMADMIIVCTFFLIIVSAWGYFLCEFVSAVADKVTGILKKRKEKKESDENRIAEH